MSAPLTTLSLTEWDARYAELREAGLKEPAYGGPLSRHRDEGDLRLARLRFDPSPAALRLWNFLLTEEERLAQSDRLLSRWCVVDSLRDGTKRWCLSRRGCIGR